MEYFYTPPHNISSGLLTIEDDEFNHLTHVMRKKAGDALHVVDGIGNAFDVILTDVAKRAAHCRIQSHHRMLYEPTIDVTLAVGVLKNSSRFDFLVEKCTELGVNAIVPLLTERTIPHHARTERLQKLALAAMKQCGRCVLPKVHEATSFAHFIASVDASSLKIIPHEKVTATNITGIGRDKSITSVAICIGAEGGFTDGEIEQAQCAGFVPVSLGERRLRTETAAIVAVSSVIMHTQ